MGWIRVRKLGQGGYGFVSLGRSTSSPDSIPVNLELPSQFAVKSAPFKDSESLVYERELIHQLRQCPSIVRCYGADASNEDDHGILYNLFLELAAGGSLVDRIYSGKPMDEEEVKDYTRSILFGLSHMHSQGIVHCDIKPANILLVEDGESYIAKIADFGLAILENQTDVEKLIGTVPYLAPESILRGDYGPAVDIWALGCTVVEMLVQKRLRKLDGKFELNIETVEKMATQEVEIPFGISAEARHFLIRCLNPNPLLRWDADRLLRETSFLAELGADSGGEDYIPLGDESDANAESDVDEDDELTKPMLLLKRDREAEEDHSDSENSAIYPAFCKKRRLDHELAAPCY